MAHGVKTLDLMIALFGRWSCRNGCGNSEMVREPGSFLVVADSVQLHGEQVLAQDLEQGFSVECPPWVGWGMARAVPECADSRATV